MDELLIQAKKQKRSQLKALLSTLSESSFSLAGQELASTLKTLSVWKEAQSLCAFLSMKGELDTHSLLENAFQDSKLIAVPRTNVSDLDFRIISSLQGPWDHGPYGIREPVLSSETLNLETMPGPVLVITPGLGFDPRGRRLGRGKGYYDRFLQRLRSLRGDVHAIGIGLPLQLIDSIPVGSSDEDVDALCIGGRYIPINP
ncbi:5-formyltetrahydrofolate cyclo-ligase [Treponema sp.]